MNVGYRTGVKNERTVKLKVHSAMSCYVPSENVLQLRNSPVVQKCFSSCITARLRRVLCAPLVLDTWLWSLVSTLGGLYKGQMSCCILRVYTAGVTHRLHDISMSFAVLALCILFS